MIQWIGVAIAVIGLIYGGIKDIQSGTIKIPNYTTNTQTTQEPAQKIIYPIQYCLMAYDPNTDKVWYQHEDGSWKETAPPQKKVLHYY